MQEQLSMTTEKALCFNLPKLSGLDQRLLKYYVATFLAVRKIFVFFVNACILNRTTS